ncbi:MAG TPA: hypothetical protein VGF03_08700 [Bryobacteraceae bacterium]|jgi:hypothetical protein
MSAPAVFLVLISDATRHSLDFWLNWLIIGCCSFVLVLEWFLYRIGKESLRRALWFGGGYGVVIIAALFELLRK